MTGQGYKLVLLAFAAVLYVLLMALPSSTLHFNASSAPANSEILGLPAKGMATSGAALVGTLVLLVSWLLAGIDPKRGVVHPQFEPPDNIGPAEARHLKEQRVDDRCLAAAIVNMAVKGALRIDERPSLNPLWTREFRLEPLGWMDRGLTLSERAAYWALFPTSESLRLNGDRANGRRVDRAREDFQEQLWAGHHGTKFSDNLGHLLVGLGVGASLAAILLLLITQDLKYAFGQFVVWIGATILTPMYALLLASLWMSRYRMLRDARALLSTLVLIAGSCVGFPYVMYLVMRDDLSNPKSDLDILMLGSGVVFGVIVTVFYFLMATPTKSGRRLMDHIEGFALFVRTAEEERLDILHPLERSSKSIDDLLPYVVALGEKHAWSKEFVTALRSTTAPR